MGSMAQFWDDERIDNSGIKILHKMHRSKLNMYSALNHKENIPYLHKYEFIVFSCFIQQMAGRSAYNHAKIQHV
jgi:hypothetical protein